MRSGIVHACARGEQPHTVRLVSDPGERPRLECSTCGAIRPLGRDEFKTARKIHAARAGLTTERPQNRPWRRSS